MAGVVTSTVHLGTLPAWPLPWSSPHIHHQGQGSRLLPGLPVPALTSYSLSFPPRPQEIMNT